MVNRVYGLVRPAKAGHAGTLDPLATGVLVVAVGSATRLIQYSHRLPKRYQATFLLGQRSASDDVETEAEILTEAPVPDRSQIEQVLLEFLGDIQQVPPAYAAVKVKGQRAYKLARRGENVEMKPRGVTIHDLSVARYAYPELVLDIECSSGTYVRSLGRDIAVRLGTGAVMSALLRTAIGSLRVADAADVDQLEGRLDELLQSPLPLVSALSEVKLTAAELEKLHNGLNINVEASRLPAVPPGSELVGIGREGQIASILQYMEHRILKPLCNFPQSR